MCHPRHPYRDQDNQYINCIVNKIVYNTIIVYNINRYHLTS